MKQKIFTTTLFLLACIIPINAQSPFAAGSGTAESPYEIRNAEQLQQVRSHMNAHFILKNDIHLPSEGYPIWTPIGKVNTTEVNNKYEVFSGTFDGNGHKITGINIVYSGNYVGFFSVVSGTIKNLGVEGKVQQLSGVSVGLLAGYMGQADSPGTIDNCYAKGVVQSSGMQVALLVGVATQPYGVIKGCYVSGSVINTGGNYTGGICGRMTKSVSIGDCYSTADVSGVDYVGGIIGYTLGKEMLTNTYATGKIEGNSYVGGIAGRLWTNASASNNLAFNTSVTGNSMVGRVFGEVGEGGTMENCWGLKDMNITMGGSAYSPTNNVYAKDGGHLTIDEYGLQSESSFYEDDLGWDFSETWTISEGSYPTLGASPTTGIALFKTESPINADVTSEGENWILSNLSYGNQITVYSINGQLLQRFVAHGDSITVSLPQKGVYLINISNGKTTKIVKVIHPVS